MNIYIVDDIQENIQVLGKILIEQGYNIHVARNGNQLLNGIQKMKPDLILLDISMPGMDGYEVCKILKADNSTRDIPIIFLTARTEKNDIVKGFRTGGVDYITKPFYAEELLARVNTHLELKRARDMVIQQKEDLQLKNNELYNMSITDNLTKAYNRRYMMEVLEKEFSRSQRHSSDLSCIIFDIDHFKKFNDTYGHQAGDFVLEETAGRVKEGVRKEDYFARYGGEEFIILLPDINIDMAFSAAEKIRMIVESSHYIREKLEVSVTISLGVSSFGRNHPKTQDELVYFADTALFQAKESGRNCSVIYNRSGE